MIYIHFLKKHLAEGLLRFTTVQPCMPEVVYKELILCWKLRLEVDLKVVIPCIALRHVSPKHAYKKD